MPECLSQPVLLLWGLWLPPSRTQRTRLKGLMKVRVRYWAGEAVLGLKDDQSLAVDLHRGQLAHQTLELKFRSLRRMSLDKQQPIYFVGYWWLRIFSTILGFLPTTVFVLTVWWETLWASFQEHHQNLFILWKKSVEGVANQELTVKGYWLIFRCFKTFEKQTQHASVQFNNIITAEAIKIVSTSASNSKYKHRVLVYNLSHHGCRHHPHSSGSWELMCAPPPSRTE